MGDDWRIERLRGEHDRASFECGEPEMDDWLRRFARQNDDKEVGRTFVAVRNADLRVWGYHTLRSGSVARDVLPEPAARRLPRYPVPVVHLARLAVDRNARGERLGERLLMHALDRALAVSEAIGVFAVEIVALDDAARTFYARYGFASLLDDPRHMYISMAAVRSAFRR